MLKMGNTCYISTLESHIFPIDIALGKMEMRAGNATIVPEDEVEEYDDGIVGVTNPPASYEDVDFGLIQEITNF